MNDGLVFFIEIEEFTRHKMDEYALARKKDLITAYALCVDLCHK